MHNRYLENITNIKDVDKGDLLIAKKILNYERT